MDGVVGKLTALSNMKYNCSITKALERFTYDLRKEYKRSLEEFSFEDLEKLYKVLQSNGYIGFSANTFLGKENVRNYVKNKILTTRQCVTSDFPSVHDVPFYVYPSKAHAKVLFDVLMEKNITLLV